MTSELGRRVAQIGIDIQELVSEEHSELVSERDRRQVRVRALVAHDEFGGGDHDHDGAVLAMRDLVWGRGFSQHSHGQQTEGCHDGDP